MKVKNSVEQITPFDGFNFGIPTKFITKIIKMLFYLNF